jgi:predicted RNase H-like nuclease
VCLGLGEKRVNVFQWAIVPKVKNIDLVIRRQEGIQDRIREGHPEVSFARMNGDTPLLSKKKPMGLEQRKNLLRSYFPDLRINAPHLEDVLDAYALLWTARRIERNTEQMFPEVPEFDRYALRMEIAA